MPYIVEYVKEFHKIARSMNTSAAYSLIASALAALINCRCFHRYF